MKTGQKKNSQIAQQNYSKQVQYVSLWNMAINVRFTIRLELANKLG